MTEPGTSALPDGTTPRAPRNGLATGAYLIVILWGLSVGRDFLIPLCIAALLSFLVLPVFRFLIKFGLPSWIAVTLGTVLLLLPFLLTGYMLVRQGQTLVRDFPQISKSLQQMVARFSQSDVAHKFHLEESLSLSVLSEKVGESASASAHFIASGLRALLETGSQFVLVFILTILMVALRKHLRVTSEKLIARFENIHGANMLDAVVSLIEQFLLARMVIVVAVTLLSWLVVALFGVPYSFLLGAVVGILTLIPELGFVISLVPVIAVAAATGHSLLSVTGLGCAIFVIHLIEANVVSPKLVGHKLNINVLAGFIGLFGGGLLWGVWGMFLSVPILGVLRIVLSAAPALQPWGELLSEREDQALTRLIILRHKLPLFFLSGKAPDGA